MCCPDCEVKDLIIHTLQDELAKHIKAAKPTPGAFPPPIDWDKVFPKSTTR